ncbi:hypothetical protein D9M72_489210 [compost metagenome]
MARRATQVRDFQPDPGQVTADGAADDAKRLVKVRLLGERPVQDAVGIDKPELAQRAPQCLRCGCRIRGVGQHQRGGGQLPWQRVGFQRIGAQAAKVVEHKAGRTDLRRRATAGKLPHGRGLAIGIAAQEITACERG